MLVIRLDLFALFGRFSALKMTLATTAYPTTATSNTAGAPVCS
jgi:hypothetical protein